MDLRKLITSAAFVMTLSAGGFYATQTLAQKGQIYTPSAPWAVKPVAGNQAGQGYCALAKRFSDGAILSIARNTDGQSSLALDLQKQAFQTGQDLKIILDPGAGGQRVFKVAPVSANALVVRMGKDQPFFHALETTGFLRIHPEGYPAYNFDLSDIDSGQGRLDSCLAGMISPAAGEDESPLAGADNSFRLEINDLRQKVEDLETENAKLSNLLEQQRTETVTPGDEEYLADLAALEAENIELRSKLVSLKERVSTEKAGTENQAELTGLRAQIETLKQENKSLREEIALNLTSEKDKAVTALKTRIDDLRARNRELEDRLAAAAAKGEQDIAAAVERYKQDNKNLRRQLKEARRKLAALPEADLDPELENALKENRALKAALEEARKVDNPDKSLMQKIKNLKKENNVLQIELDEVQSGLVMASASKSADPGPDREKTIEELKGALEEARREKTRALQALQEENARLKARLSAQKEKPAPGDASVKTAAPLPEKDVPVAAIRLPSRTASDMESADTTGLTEAQQMEGRLIDKIQHEVEEMGPEVTTLSGSQSRPQPRPERDNKEQLTARDVQDAAYKPSKPSELAEEARPDVVQPAYRPENSYYKETTETLPPEPESIAVTVDGRAPPPPVDIAAQTEDRGRAADAESQTAEMDSQLKEKPDKPRSLAYTRELMAQQNRRFSSGDREKRNREEETTAAAPVTAMPQVSQEAGIVEYELKEPETVPPRIPPPSAAPLPETTDLVQDIQSAAQTTARPELARKESAKEHDISPAARPAAYEPEIKIAELLERAQIVPLQEVDLVENATGPARAVFQWKADKIYGSAEQKVLGGEHAFDTHVKIYLEETQRRCNGDYAIVPDNTVQKGAMRIDSYEIACIGGNVKSSASLLFFNRGDTFTVVAHEAPAERMAEAMELRDRLMNMITSARL